MDADARAERGKKSSNTESATNKKAGAKPAFCHEQVQRGKSVPGCDRAAKLVVDARGDQIGVST
jgi:hypothetical protein